MFVFVKWFYDISEYLFAFSIVCTNINASNTPHFSVLYKEFRKKALSSFSLVKSQKTFVLKSAF